MENNKPTLFTIELIVNNINAQKIDITIVLNQDLLIKDVLAVLDTAKKTQEKAVLNYLEKNNIKPTQKKVEKLIETLTIKDLL